MINGFHVWTCNTLSHICELLNTWISLVPGSIQFYHRRCWTQILSQFLSISSLLATLLFSCMHCDLKFAHFHEMHLLNLKLFHEVLKLEMHGWSLFPELINWLQWKSSLLKYGRKILQPVWEWSTSPQDWKKLREEKWKLSFSQHQVSYDLPSTSDLIFAFQIWLHTTLSWRGEYGQARGPGEQWRECEPSPQRRGERYQLQGTGQASQHQGLHPHYWPWNRRAHSGKTLKSGRKSIDRP